MYDPFHPADIWTWKVFSWPEFRCQSRDPRCKCNQSSEIPISLKCLAHKVQWWAPRLQCSLWPQDWLGRDLASGEQFCCGGLQNTHQEIKMEKICLFHDYFYNQYLIFHYTIGKKQILWSTFQFAHKCILFSKKTTRILIVTLLYSWRMDEKLTTSSTNSIFPCTYTCKLCTSLPETFKDLLSPFTLG